MISVFAYGLIKRKVKKKVLVLVLGSKVSDFRLFLGLVEFSFTIYQTKGII